MSIIISNVSEKYSRTGEQEYIIKLNNIPLANFTHLSEKGMAECLRAAALAMDKVDVDKKVQQHRALRKLSLEDAYLEKVQQGYYYSD